MSSPGASSALIVVDDAACGHGTQGSFTTPTGVSCALQRRRRDRQVYDLVVTLSFRFFVGSRLGEEHLADARHSAGIQTVASLKL